MRRNFTTRFTLRAASKTCTRLPPLVSLVTGELRLAASGAAGGMGEISHTRLEAEGQDEEDEMV